MDSASLTPARSNIALVDLITKSWAPLKSRDHTVYAVFPFSPKAEEVMLHGRSHNVSLNDEHSTFTWAARMHLTWSGDDKVLIDKYTIIVVSAHLRHCRLFIMYTYLSTGPSSIQSVECEKAVFYSIYCFNTKMYRCGRMSRQRTVIVTTSLFSHLWSYDIVRHTSLETRRVKVYSYLLVAHVECDLIKTCEAHGKVT